MNVDYSKGTNMGGLKKDEVMNKISNIKEAIKTNSDLSKYQDLINDFLSLVKDYYNGKYKGIEMKNIFY